MGLPINQNPDRTRFASRCGAGLFLFLFLSLAIIALSPGKKMIAQTEALVPGKLIKQVFCRDHAEQSYAVYLPSGYTPDRRWPIIYGFDPGARGSRPVECYQAAAEKYGYLVVGSNNSRNGPNVPLNEILKSLWEDTHQRFAIDEQRVYATGFSGGARVAFSIAGALRGQIAGVIACGAGFPGDNSPPKDLPFVVFGIAGKEDFNLIELKRVGRTLDSLGLTNRLMTFDGDHSWPPEPVCTMAVEWMEVQAIKAGKRKPDQAFIAEMLAKSLARARAAEAAKKTFDAYLEYDALAKDFQSLQDVAEFAAKADELRSSKEVKAALKQERDEEQAQLSEVRNFFTLREQLKATDNRALASNQLRNFIGNLKRKAANREENSDRLVARRVLSQLAVALIEEAANLRYYKKYSEAAQNLALAVEIRPDNPQLFFSLARAHALAGEKRPSIEALRKAFEKGLTAGDDVTSNPELDSIRNEAGYKRLIEEFSRQGQDGIRNQQR